VANLPFTVDDQGLHDVFKEFAPVTSHVVIKRNGRSKGFGFVTFKNHDDQQRALALDKKEVQGRALIVRVAQQAEEGQEGAAGEKKEEK